MITTEDIDKIAAAVAETLSKMTPLHQKEILTLDEAAQYTGLTKSTLYKLTSNREIAYSKPNGKMCFFKRTELDDWMMSNPVATTAELNGLALAHCMKKPTR